MNHSFTPLGDCALAVGAISMESASAIRLATSSCNARMSSTVESIFVENSDRPPSVLESCTVTRSRSPQR